MLTDKVRLIFAVKNSYLLSKQKWDSWYIYQLKARIVGIFTNYHQPQSQVYQGLEISPYVYVLYSVSVVTQKW